MFIFFNDTATTETYTYLHTLPRHDALPISAQRHRHRRALARAQRPGRDAGGAARVAQPVDEDLSRPLRLRHRCHVALRRMFGHGVRECIAEGAHRVRSEEHTSELQSLMRISYAVFCLKKQSHHVTYVQKS